MGDVMDIGFVAGLGWGCAFGLAVALAVSLWPKRLALPQPSEPQASTQREPWPRVAGT